MEGLHTKEYQVFLFAPGGQMQWQGNEGTVNMCNLGEQQLSEPVALLCMGKAQVFFKLDYTRVSGSRANDKIIQICGSRLSPFPKNYQTSPEIRR